MYHAAIAGFSGDPVRQLRCAQPFFATKRMAAQTPRSDTELTRQGNVRAASAASARSSRNLWARAAPFWVEAARDLLILRWKGKQLAVSLKLQRSCQMIKLSVSVCIDAPASKVWAALSELDEIHVWNESIHRSYCQSDQHRGVDAVRVCELGGNVTVKETIIAWEEGRSFTYTGQGVPLIKRAVNTWRIAERGGQTLLTSSQRWRSKGYLWRLIEPILLAASQNVGAGLWRGSNTWWRMARPTKGMPRNSCQYPLAAESAWPQPAHVK